LPGCTFQQLRFAALDGNGLTGGTVTTGLLIRNVGDRPCSLLGTPTIRLLDTHRRLIRPQFAQLDGLFDPQRPVGLAAHAAEQPAGQAIVPVSISVYDATLDGCPARDYFHVGFIRLRWNATRTVTVDARSADLRDCAGIIRTGSFETR
jgi:hypothetical protein